jgi:hypothetical protein
MRIVPGLASMRAPARFAALLSFTVVFFAARGLDGVLGAIRQRWARAAALASIAALLLFELAPRPLHWVEVLRPDEFPAVYSWLARQPDVHALVEVPLRQNWREAERMYYSTLHWKPIVNGYSSFVPPLYQRLAEHMSTLPDAAGLDLLRGLGVTHVVVHLGEAAKSNRREVGAAALGEWERRSAGRAKLLYSSGLPGAAGTDRVYRLLDARPGT